MKFKTLTLLLIFVISVFLFSSCKKEKCTETMTYKTYVPVYMSYAAMRSAVKTMPAQPLKSPGKIYVKGNYLFVNELNSGIHVFDNTNPSSPQNIAFINIPGNVDMATCGNTLYADNYIDLLAFNISNINNITLANRVEGALPYISNYNGYYADSTQGVVSSWQSQNVTQKISADCNNSGSGIVPMGGPVYNDAYIAPTTAGSNISNTSAPVNAPGTGGSSARFTVSNNTLYMVGSNNLLVYDITNTTNPTPAGTQYLGWSIETIFPFNNHLFIGSSDGVYIFDISSRLNPVFVSVYSHLTACDPVVVDTQYAYFTLSGDAPCHMGYNELDIVNISNLSNPTLTLTMPLTDPKGIGLDTKTLFICDNNDGLRVYNVTDVNQIQNNLIAHFANINAFDVIPYNKDLIMTGSGGIYQYNYSNVQNITLMSTIAVSN